MSITQPTVSSNVISSTASGVTPATYGQNSNPDSAQFAVPTVTVDTYGRVTSASSFTPPFSSGGFIPFWDWVHGGSAQPTDFIMSYFQMGQLVYCTFAATGVTTTSTSPEVHITLPLPTTNNFAGTIYELQGVALSNSTQTIQLSSDAGSNNKMILNFSGVAMSNATIQGSFSYGAVI